AIGLDARDGRLRVAGWTAGAETTATAAAAAAAGLGAAAVIYTDIGRDGTERGPDLDGTRAVARAAGGVPVIASGGIGAVDDVRALLKAGADKVSINTAAVARPDFVREAAERFGTQCVVVAIDARRRAADDPARGWEVFTHGGRTPTGLDAVEWAARTEAAGAGEILLTSMDRDGTRLGYDLALTRAVVDRAGIPVIASGGAGTREHPSDGLTTAGGRAALV